MCRNCCLTILLVTVLLSTPGWSLEEKALLGEYPLAPGVVLTLSPHSSVGMVLAKLTGRDPFLLVEEECCQYTIPEIDGQARFSQMDEDSDVALRLEVYGHTITAWKSRSGQQPTPEAVAGSIADQLDTFVPVWMLQHNVPGVSIALIRDRKIAWTKQFGLKKLGEPGRVNEDSVFEACSMSKPLFAYAVMKLIEEKKLHLDRTLDSYLPEPYLPNEPDAGKITVRMVLNHTTGLPNWRKGGRRNGKVLTLNYPPGQRFTYSGEGMWYLQHVVEHITGKPINEYMTETVMSRIGMDRSSYAWRDEYPEDYAHGHTNAGKPNNYGFYHEGNTAFSLYTTPADYARYLILMMDTTPDEDFQLQRRTVDRMLNIESQRGQGYYYGLGWAIGGKPGRRYVFHGGSNGSGFRCHARFYRTNGSGIVVMTNARSGVPVYNKILDLVFPE